MTTRSPVFLVATILALSSPALAKEGSLVSKLVNGARKMLTRDPELKFKKQFGIESRLFDHWKDSLSLPVHAGMRSDVLAERIHFALERLQGIPRKGTQLRMVVSEVPTHYGKREIVRSYTTGGLEWGTDGTERLVERFPVYQKGTSRPYDVRSALYHGTMAMDRYLALKARTSEAEKQLGKQVPTEVRVEREGRTVIFDLRDSRKLRQQIVAEQDGVLRGVFDAKHIQNIRDELSGKISKQDLAAIAAWRQDKLH